MVHCQRDTQRYEASQKRGALNVAGYERVGHGSTSVAPPTVSSSYLKIPSSAAAAIRALALAAVRAPPLLWTQRLVSSACCCVHEYAAGTGAQTTLARPAPRRPTCLSSGVSNAVDGKGITLNAAFGAPVTAHSLRARHKANREGRLWRMVAAAEMKVVVWGGEDTALVALCPAVEASPLQLTPARSRPPRSPTSPSSAVSLSSTLAPRSRSPFRPAAPPPHYSHRRRAGRCEDRAGGGQPMRQRSQAKPPWRQFTGKTCSPSRHIHPHRGGSHWVALPSPRYPLPTAYRRRPHVTMKTLLFILPPACSPSLYAHLPRIRPSLSASANESIPYAVRFQKKYEMIRGAQFLARPPVPWKIIEYLVRTNKNLKLSWTHSGVVEIGPLASHPAHVLLKGDSKYDIKPFPSIGIMDVEGAVKDNRDYSARSRAWQRTNQKQFGKTTKRQVLQKGIMRQFFAGQRRGVFVLDRRYFESVSHPRGCAPEVSETKIGLSSASLSERTQLRPTVRAMSDLRSGSEIEGMSCGWVKNKDGGSERQKKSSAVNMTLGGGWVVAGRVQSATENL
ncbi:hypothetical protein B0H13DRAFT_1872625 [Mycena leptocephala]|nr:hypothetical protein B0H13DRAFT_1872625 [Mycena leptocephala]